MKRKIMMMTAVLTAVFGQYMPTLSTPKAINNQYPTVKVSIGANYKPVTGSLNPPPVNSPYAPNVVQQSIIKRPPYVAKPVKEITTCPILEISDYEEQKDKVTPFFIIPMFFTYTKGVPIQFDLTAKGEDFNIFYMQMKDFEDNSIIGQWQVIGENSEAFQCDKSGSIIQHDTLYWNKKDIKIRKLTAEWILPLDHEKTPKKIIVVASFKSDSGVYQTSYSAVLQQRSDVNLKTCCELEISSGCQRMCGAKNLVEALSSALENCKLEIYKLQRCFMTEKSPMFKPTSETHETDIMTQTDEVRSACCSQDSVQGDCLSLCTGNDMSNWSNLYKKCQGVNRQIYSCWSKSSCVGRCDEEDLRSDHKCQCDEGCEGRGDCCPDLPKICYKDLPVDLLYWATPAITCNAMPRFSDFKFPKLTKEMSLLRIDETSNPLRSIPPSNYILKMQTYFDVKKDGAYKFYIVLGETSQGFVYIDGKFVSQVMCPFNPSAYEPTIFNVLLPMGGHELKIEIANAGPHQELKLAYSGPDTKNKPAQVRPVHKNGLEMGYPAELSKIPTVVTPQKNRYGNNVIPVARAPVAYQKPVFDTPKPPVLTARPSDVQTPVPRAPWARPGQPLPAITARPALSPMVTTQKSKAVIKMKSNELNQELDEDLDKATEGISPKIIAGTVFGVLSGIAAACIIFKYF